MSFRWYHVDAQGMAEVVGDCPAVGAQIDAGAPGWFGSPEGAIIHGGVVATAYTRRVVEVFDAVEAIMNGRRVSRGFITETKITASREA